MINAQFSQQRVTAGLAGVIALITLLGIVYAQSPVFNDEPSSATEVSPSEKHLALVKSIFREFTDPQRSRSCVIDFTVTVVSRMYGKPDTTITEVHYAGNPDRLIYESEQMSFYQDDSVAVAVIPEHHNLFITRSSKEALHDRNTAMFAKLQDSLFDKCQILEDQEVDEFGGRRMILLPDARMRKLYAIDRVTLQFNPEQLMLQNIKVDFIQTNVMASTEMNYDRVEWDVNPVELDKPILERFFSGDTKTLMAEYKGYSVIDKRGVGR